MTEDTSPNDRCELCLSVSSSSSYLAILCLGVRTIQAPACATTPVPLFMVSIREARQCSVQKAISLTDDKILVQRQAFLLRGISPPSEQRFLLAGTRLSVFFVVGHLS